MINYTIYYSSLLLYFYHISYNAWLVSVHTFSKFWNDVKTLKCEHSMVCRMIVEENNDERAFI